MRVLADWFRRLLHHRLLKALTRGVPPTIRASALREGTELLDGQVVLLVERNAAACTVRVVPSFGESLVFEADDEVAVAAVTW